MAEGIIGTKKKIVKFWKVQKKSEGGGMELGGEMGGKSFGRTSEEHPFSGKKTTRRHPVLWVGISTRINKFCKI